MALKLEYPQDSFEVDAGSESRLVISPSLPLSLRQLMESGLSPSPSISDSAEASPRSAHSSPSNGIPSSDMKDSRYLGRNGEREEWLRASDLSRGSTAGRGADLEPPEDVTCVYFSQVGYCRNGSECRFSHQQVSSRPPLCKFYKSARGCHFGDSCRYSHEAILCERVKVPESCLGALIGKNGTTRARLEAESRIENITIMTSSSEVVLTARDQAGIQRASKLIMEVVKECELRQQSKVAAAVASASKSVSAKGDEVEFQDSPRSGTPSRIRRLRHHKRRSQQSPTSPVGVQSGWHQCPHCRKSFSTMGALNDHQRAKGHMAQAPILGAASLGASPISLSPASIQSSHPVMPLSSHRASPPSGSGLYSEDELESIDVHLRRVRFSPEMSADISSEMSPSASLSESDGSKSESDQSGDLQMAMDQFPLRRGLFSAELVEVWNGSSVSANGVC